jgi:hypothetical protein
MVMDAKEESHWTFLGFESAQDGRPVQVWYDRLPETHKEEIRDLLLYLEKAPSRLWRRPEFDPLIGAGGISEIRAPEIRHAGGSVIYRIYGYFGPGEHEYTFLHATAKKVRSDKHGKRIAKSRLDQLARGHATAHQFSF